MNQGFQGASVLFPSPGVPPPAVRPAFTLAARFLLLRQHDVRGTRGQVDAGAGRRTVARVVPPQQLHPPLLQLHRLVSVHHRRELIEGDVRQRPPRAPAQPRDQAQSGEPSPNALHQGEQGQTGRERRKRHEQHRHGRPPLALALALAFAFVTADCPRIAMGHSRSSRRTRPGGVPACAGHGRRPAFEPLRARAAVSESVRRLPGYRGRRAGPGARRCPCRLRG